MGRTCRHCKQPVEQASVAEETQDKIVFGILYELGETGTLRVYDNLAAFEDKIREKACAEMTQALHDVAENQQTVQGYAEQHDGPGEEDAEIVPPSNVAESAPSDVDNG